MKILYVVSDQEHGHDYGADMLFHGLCQTIGFDNVFDWPEKKCLHLGSIGERDDCQIDSDQCWPLKNHTLEHAVSQSDVAVISVGITCHNSPAFRHTANVFRSCHLPIVAIDQTDDVGNLRHIYEDAAGRHLKAYFKRELPLGSDWGFPMPFSYPATRSPSWFPDKENKVFYWAVAAGMAGVNRRYIANQIDGVVPPFQRDIRLSSVQSKGDRPPPEEYHDAMSKCTIGVSWNGAANWDCNRFWENFAFGLCQVAQRPKIQIPNPPIDGVHVCFVDRMDEVAPAIVSLLNDRVRASRIARDGHDHFMRHHTSESRARYLVDKIEELL
jgi:hypothetical protein